MRGLGARDGGGLLSGLFSELLSAEADLALIDEHAETALEESFDAIFTRLYFDLCDSFDHPFEWTCLLERPRLWRLRRHAAYRRVWGVFRRHGFLLTDGLARRFYATAPQGPGEDCGGAMVRRLREVWQVQLGVAYGGAP
ncbi:MULTISPECIES: hypothetical protein [unclassified Marinovum]|uniref:hypothetical protein n=1 Tax=unclassified Marinovum TaxID=2647166 RepID=UPI003EDC986B